MCKHAEKEDVVCPMCRNNSQTESVAYVKNQSNGEGSNTVIKGSFSTKIENITLKLMELIKEDPKVKVLIFSTVSFFFRLLSLKYFI